jgi:2-iminobutanoate/2-iminopropanoate deaminase
MQYFSSEEAPRAIGPYSQAIRRGKTIYTSGQIPLDPATGDMVQGDFEVHARRVFENLGAVLRAAGADFRDVVRATVYLKSLSDFQKLNGVYAEYFGDHKPARSTVGVAELPKGASVEIDLIAELP